MLILSNSLPKSDDHPGGLAADALTHAAGQQRLNSASRTEAGMRHHDFFFFSSCFFLASAVFE